MKRLQLTLLKCGLMFCTAYFITSCNDKKPMPQEPATHYWIPEFKLGVLLPEQSELEPKIGGHPWGLPLDQWPTCACCGKKMSHLAQLPHIDEIFDLGSSDSVLFVFQCEQDSGMCDPWEVFSGANQCLILKKADLKNSLTVAPEGVPVIGEYRITGWEKKVTPQEILDHQDEWFDHERYFQMDEKVLFHEDSYNSTKMNGVPYWTGNGPSGYPDPPYEYLGQIDTYLDCKSKPPTADEAGTPIRYNDKESQRYVEPKTKNPLAPWMLQVDEEKPDSYYGGWANLGSDGVRFLFINREKSPVEVVWYWSR